ncbi:hypothetical protein GCM10009872_32270 [Actinopolymorpha rutila]
MGSNPASPTHECAARLDVPGAKLDLKKDLDAYQAKRDQFRVVSVPDLQYLMIDGHGDPNTAPAYAGAVKALYPVAYKLKFASKRNLGRDCRLVRRRG